MGIRLDLVLYCHNYGLDFYLEILMEVSVEDGGIECRSSGYCLSVHCTPEQPETSQCVQGALHLWLSICSMLLASIKWILETFSIVLSKDLWENHSPCGCCPHQMQL